MAVCRRCGAKSGVLGMLAIDVASGDYTCQPCAQGEQEERRHKQQQAERDRQAEADRIRKLAVSVIVTTTPKVDGTQVVAYLGIESVEFVIGTGLFSEITTDVADFFGARSTAFEIKLQAAKQSAMDTLKFRAAAKGANAVIGIDMDYTEFSGNRVCLILNGTLVKLAPNRPAAPRAT